MTTQLPGQRTTLCPVHWKRWIEWRENHYQPQAPSEWPGVGTGIMDSRTSHEERAAEWQRKNQEQMDFVSRVCLSGLSPQCGEAEE